MHESVGTGMGWGRGCDLWGWGGDGSQMYGDGVAMVVKYMGMSGNGADFHYHVILYSVRTLCIVDRTQAEGSSR